MKIRLVKLLIAWLNRHYPFLLREAVIGPYAHIHLNPRKKQKAMLAEVMRGRG